VTNPLSGPIAKTVGKALKGLMLDVTYTDVDVQPRPTPDVETAYSCKGYVASFSDYFRNSPRGSQVPDDTRIVIILANTLAVTPKSGDKVTVNGETLKVDKAETDPATATWTLQARPTV